MRVLLALFLFFTACAPAAQAQWLKFFRSSINAPEILSVAQRRAVVSSYGLKVENIMKLNRLNLTPARMPAFKTATVSYYKIVAQRFPNVAVKPMAEAQNSMEDLILALPASLKPQNVLIERMNGIEKPTEVYLSALFADAWENWLASGIGSQPPAEMAVSKQDLKTAQALQRDLAEDFARKYADLPAEQKDLRTQLSLVCKQVQTQTGWSDQVRADMEEYFAGVMRPMIKKQNELTAVEFLQAYDVLAVAAEMGTVYEHRVAKGAAAFPLFLIHESIQRVRRDLMEGFIPARGSAREQRLQKWYEGLFGKEKF